MPRDHHSTPKFLVKFQGKDITQAETYGLESIVVEDHIDMVDILTLRFGGAERQPKWSFKLGDVCTVQTDTGPDTIFAGEVVALEPAFGSDGESTMTVRALDKTHRLGRGRKTRYWEGKKDSEVVTEVGAECRLSVDADETDHAHPYILQRNESNIALLKRLAARNNFVLRFRKDKLEFKKPSFEGSVAKVTMGEDLVSASFSFNTSEMVQSVVVRGWDVRTKEALVGEALARDVTKIGKGSLGATVAEAFGDARAYVTDVPVTSQTMARAVAEAEMERIARQFCHGNATIVGTGLVVAGSMVEFKGLSPSELNGPYFVISTRHIVNGLIGYMTELTFCSNSYGA